MLHANIATFNNMHRMFSQMTPIMLHQKITDMMESPRAETRKTQQNNQSGADRCYTTGGKGSHQQTDNTNSGNGSSNSSPRASRSGAYNDKNQKRQQRVARPKRQQNNNNEMRNSPGYKLKERLVTKWFKNAVGKLAENNMEQRRLLLFLEHSRDNNGGRIRKRKKYRSK